jgi:hypothetical protein
MVTIHKELEILVEEQGDLVEEQVELLHLHLVLEEEVHLI